MNKHTPAPWVVSYNMGLPYVTAEQGKRWDNPTICTLYEDVTPEDSVTAGAWLAGHENAGANARLIAAAPELLMALEAVLTAGMTPELYEYCCEVYTKATGKNPNE